MKQLQEGQPLKSENHFLTGVKEGSSDAGSDFGSRRGQTLLGHCCCFLFRDLTSSLSSVTSQISEDSSYGFLLSSPAERHLRSVLR